MTTREKIIVGIALLAVLYGAYEFVLAPRMAGSLQPPAKEALESLNAFIIKVAAASQEGKLSDTDAYIVKTAETAWQQDPMLVIPKKAAPQVVEPVKTPAMLPTAGLTYTGYMEMGDKQLAIINGVEYEAGDRLEPGGLVIRRILPNRVEVIATEHGGKTFSIPLTETD